MRRALAIVLLLLATNVASAFESECTKDSGQTRDLETTAAAICRTRKTGQDADSCGDGVQFARGAQLGEHTFLTHQAMLWAGIPEPLVKDQAVLRYYGTGENVPDSSGVVSVAPAAPSRMRAEVKRPLSIAEFAQALDGSYSLADFLNGNEHCPISTQTTGSFAELQSCHQFASHLAVVNSTHFSPQNREMGRRYHGMALQTADRCLAMHEAFAQQAVGGDAHPLAQRNTEVVEQCIKEALAIEAIASHFLEDAWSTGHMWQRWGSPLFPDDDHYVASHVAGIVSGIIHGWRSVARDADKLRNSQHDQLCMPGPLGGNDAIGPWRVTEKGADKTVTFAYPPELMVANTSGGPTPGAGDCYLLPCSAPENDDVAEENWNKNPRWSLWFDETSNQSSPLYTQRVRMMTCLRRGFEEVYERLPTQVFGALKPSVDEQLLDKAVTKADRADQNKTKGMQADACWTQRVTNESMLLAGKFGSFFGLDLWDPSLVSHAAINVGVEMGGILSPDDKARQAAVEAQRAEVDTRLRSDMVRMAMMVAFRADEMPGGTQLAELSGEVMDDIAGIKRNSEGVKLIADDAVPYLEHADRFFWLNDRFGPCVRDEDCRRNASPRSYCDPYAVVTEASGIVPGCVLHDTAVARAFREGETIYWCSLADLGDVDAARASCQEVSATSPDCKACVELVLPRLRNGCEPSAEGFRATSPSGADNRAMCDLLVDATSAPGVPRITNLFPTPRVYWPYEVKAGETEAEARERAALEACQNGNDGADGKTAVASYGYIPVPPATGDNFPVVSRTTNAGTCGLSNTPTHWYRLTASEAGNWRVRLEPVASASLGMQLPEKLKLEVFAGPGCDGSGPALQTGMPIDANGNGKSDYLELTINVATLPYEVCVRVSAADKTTRTTWRLQIEKVL